MSRTDDKNIIYQLALSRVRNMNVANAQLLIERLGSIEPFFTLSARDLSAHLDGLLTVKKIASMSRDELIKEATKEYEFIVRNNINVRFYENADYPTRLKQCEDAPIVIYTIGNANLDSRHILSIVGTRNATPYGCDITQRIVTELADEVEDLCIVSGLALGIDVAAHRAAINNDITTIGVMGHGLNTIYPAVHRDLAARMIRDGGMLATEYMSSEAIHRGNFLARNRIVAGLADATLVVESDIKGGAMTTASIAFAYNRDVLAVPGRIGDKYSRGCNDLIFTNKAVLVRDAEDIMHATGWTAKVKEGHQEVITFEMSEEQKKIYEFIINNPTATINDMCVKLAMSYASLADILFTMEMNEIILSIPGGRYMVTAKN